MKFLNPKIHGYLDYAVILILFIAPSLFNFATEAARVSYVLGVLYLALVIATAYPLGIFKLIPFTIHGAIELVLSPILVALPWIAGFAYEPASRYFYVVAGIVLFLVWLTTDYKAADLRYGKRGLDIGGHGRASGATA